MSLLGPVSLLGIPLAPSAVWRTDLRARYREPRREDYADTAAYVRDWTRWRAFHREHELTASEAAVRLDGFHAEALRRMRQPLG